MGDDAVEPMTGVAVVEGTAATRPYPPDVPAEPRSSTLWHDGDAEWLERCSAAVAFSDTACRLPRDASGASAAERHLARWLKQQRELVNAGRLAERRARHLDADLPGWRSPRESAWRAAAVAVGLHLAETGRYPMANAADAAERRLATWLRTQRTAMRDGALAADRLAWLDLNLPSWQRPEDDAWDAAAALLADFAAEHGRLPRDTAGTAERERSLARWLRRQREAARDDRLDDERRRQLDAAAPGWLDPSASRWVRTARMFARWTAEHRSTPSKHAADPVERRLGEWLAAQRRLEASDALRADRAAWLDRAAPGWRARPDAAWRARLAELAAFAEAHGLPRRSRDAGDDERRLAAWLAGQRSAARAGTLDESRKRRLDAAVVGWHDDEREWRTLADRLVRHLGVHERFPSGGDTVPESRTLARWLQRQRALAAAGDLEPARERWLDRQLPGWRDRYLSGWLAMATRLRRFRTEHGRLPARGSAAGALERELAVWINNQRAARRRGCLAVDRERWLDAHLPEWRDARLASWLCRAQEVLAYAAERGRLPYERSTVADSRRLGIWLQSQRRALAAGRLDAARLDWLDRQLPGWNGRTGRPAVAPLASEAPLRRSAPLDPAPLDPAPATAASNRRLHRIA